MPVSERYEFFLDPSRCIGCNACVQACGECGTHKGYAMIQLDFIDRAASPQTIPLVCMHCESPTCAEVCPADAIKKTGDGVVQSARKPRCVACNNCVLACPFGIPKMQTEMHLMMKCDMCYDRSSVGKKPMCGRSARVRRYFLARAKKSKNCVPARVRSTRSSSASRASRRKCK
jgi:Fe-S-cluster-containing dehydrogenase component